MTPTILTRLRWTCARFCTALGAMATAASAQTPSETPRTDLWAPSGPPAHVAVVGRTLYMTAGQVGPPTGSLALLDATTGLPHLPFATVEGEVRALAADGAGGWYVAGALKMISGQPVSQVAHIATDGSVRDLEVTATGSSPGITDIALVGSNLVLAGSFDRINGQPRAFIGAIDAASGALLPWDPAPDGAVTGLAVDGDRLYVIGSFNVIGGAGPVRIGAARFDGPDLVRSAWAPLADGTARAIAIDGPTVYLAGDLALPGLSRKLQVVAVDAGSGAATGWNVDVQSGSGVSVDALAAGGGAVYLGGDFEAVGGQSRGALAAVDAATGAVLPFDVSVSHTSSLGVHDMLLTAEGLVITGSFSRINLDDRRGLAMVGAVTGDTLPWDPNVAGLVRVVAQAAPAEVAVAGSFAVVGGEMRSGTAAIDLDTGELLPWTVNLEKRSRDTSFTISGLIATQDRVYLSGTFEKVDGFVMNGLAAVSPIDGSLDTSFDHALTPSSLGYGVSRICRSDGHIHAQVATELYGLDEATGTPVWVVPGIGGTSRIAADPDSPYVYVMGRVEQADPPAVRDRLAELDSSTGKITAWNPAPDDDARALAFWDGHTIVGGSFRAIGGEIRPKLAVFEGSDPATRRLAPAPLWEFALGETDDVSALGVAGDLMLMSGSLTKIRGHSIDDIAALRLPEIRPLDWEPEIPGFSLVTEHEVIVAGSFGHYGGVYSPNLAVLPIESGCRADLTGDGVLDFFDFLAFQNFFAAGDPRADFTGDGVLDFFDFLEFQNEFSAGCP